MKRRGWNVSNKNLAEIIDFINSFEADTKEKERDLAILRYAFNDGMSAMQIAELNDDIIVCHDNHTYLSVFQSCRDNLLYHLFGSIYALCLHLS